MMKGQLKVWSFGKWGFKEWSILEWSVGSIFEAHPPLVDVHQHEAVWVVARRPE
jgi:hypothetical protein